MTYRYCPQCQDETAFEAPPCADGHEHCPDLACSECGAAIVVGLAGLLAAAAPSRQVTEPVALVARAA